MREPLGLLLAGALCCTGVPAQAESPPVPDPMGMVLEASMSDAGIGLQVSGAHDNGLVAVLYGPEGRTDVRLPFGIVLEVKPLGVLAWGRSDRGNWRTDVGYDTRYSAGLKFRLQAFSLGTNEAGDDSDFLTLRASHSIVIQLPKEDAVDQE